VKARLVGRTRCGSGMVGSIQARTCSIDRRFRAACLELQKVTSNKKTYRTLKILPLTEVELLEVESRNGVRISEAQHIWKVHGRGVLEVGRRIVSSEPSSLMRDAHLPATQLTPIFFLFLRTELYSTLLSHTFVVAGYLNMSNSSPLPAASAAHAIRREIPSPPGALAFLVHSQESVAKNTPPEIDNKALARQKRRRTRYFFLFFAILLAFRLVHVELLRDAPGLWSELRFAPTPAHPA
jgi:hypothetical protein